MLQLKGKGISAGVAIGPLQIFERIDLNITWQLAKDSEQELTRLKKALEIATNELDKLANELSKTLGEENALLFDIHKMMLEDEDYLAFIKDFILSKGCKAESAVQEASKHFAHMFSTSDNDYMKERAADVVDVSRRLLEALTGKRASALCSNKPTVLASDDFAPSETAQFQCENVLALLMTHGASNSHAAIFARANGMPTVIGLVDIPKEYADKTVIVDGTTGDVILDPDAETLECYQKKLAKLTEDKKLLEEYVHIAPATRSGHRVKVYANIGNVADATAALKQGAEGIGLFRSEYLFLESAKAPDEQTQFLAYKGVAEVMSGKMVVIRTLDIGADKKVDYLSLPQEENPALGLRAIRLCLNRPELFTVQLRAIYRASAFGKIAIMLPMITGLSELLTAKQMAKQVQEQLQKEGIAYDAKVPIGIMIETPSSAILSDILAKEVDFFSVGTNDLSQYTLALDRQNESLAPFADKENQAVLRLIAIAAKNAKENGIWIGICGELASDPSLTSVFANMGINELSVSAPMISTIKRAVCETL